MSAMSTHYTVEIYDTDHTRDDHKHVNICGGTFQTIDAAKESAQKAVKIVKPGHEVEVLVYVSEGEQWYGKLVAEFKSPEVMF